LEKRCARKYQTPGKFVTDMILTQNLELVRRRQHWIKSTHPKLSTTYWQSETLKLSKLNPANPARSRPERASYKMNTHYLDDGEVKKAVKRSTWADQGPGIHVLPQQEAGKTQPKRCEINESRARGSQI
jgi:hypothetical protein